MSKRSKQEPALVGSVASNDCSAKRNNEWPSKHHQAGRDAEGRVPMVCRSDYSLKSSSPCMDGWKKTAIWTRKENDNTKGEAAGCPRWETVSNQSCEKYKDDSTIACKRGWNESEDGNAKRILDEGGDAIRHDGLVERRQSSPIVHMVDTSSLSKSACWDRVADANERQETGGWSKWPGALSKTTRQCTSHQIKKGNRNQSEGWTTSEDGGRQSRSNIHAVNKGSLSKPASWDQVKYENVKREDDGWPGAMSKTTRQCTGHQNSKGYWNQSEGWSASKNGSTMAACKRGWNESGDGKEKIENGGDAFNHDSHESGPNIHTVDKGSLSKASSWERAKDETAKKGSDGWRIWPGAMSKTSRQCTSHQNKNVFRNNTKGWATSEDDSNMVSTKDWNNLPDGKEKKGIADVSDAFGRDGWRPSTSNFNMVDKSSLSKSTTWDQAKCDNAKRETNGWPSWPGSMSKTIGKIPSHQIRKTGWQSQGWTAPDDGDMQKETGGRNQDLVQSVDQSMQHASVMTPKCDRNTPVSWNASKGDSLDRDQRKWDPRKQISSTPPPKADRRKFRSEAVAQGENSIRRKSKWSSVPDVSDPDTSKQHRLKWGASMSSTSGCNGNQNGKDGWSQSWGRIASEHGDYLKENDGRITDLDQIDDPGMEQRPFRGRRISFHAGEYEHYQSNDSYKKGSGGVSAHYKDSPLGRGQRRHEVRHQFGDAVQKYPDRDERIGFEDPWKQRDHLQDIGFHNEGAMKNKSLQTHTSCDRFHDSFENRSLVKDDTKEICHGRRDSYKGKDVPNEDFREADVQLSENLHDTLQNKSSDYKWDQKNTGNVSSWNVPKVSQTIVDGSHSQPPLRRGDEVLRDDTIKSMVRTPKQIVANSPPVSKSQPSTQNFTSQANSTIQSGQNMQVGGPRHPSVTRSSNPNGQSRQPALNSKDEARNHEQQAMFNLLHSSASDPVLVQASRFSPAIIGQNTSTTPEEPKTSSKKTEPFPITVPPSDKILNTRPHFVEHRDDQTMKSWNASHSEAVDLQLDRQSNSSKKYEKEEVGASWEIKDDEGILMFKFALAEHVKEIIKPVWKDGRLSKEAHKTVVKKVVDKVFSVLGSNIPQTRENIDLYLSYAKVKLHKLVQDYLELFINT